MCVCVRLASTIDLGPKCLASAGTTTSGDLGGTSSGEVLRPLILETRSLDARSKLGKFHGFRLRLNLAEFSGWNPSVNLGKIPGLKLSGPCPGDV